MNNTFELVGKIRPARETEKFKPYSTKRFDSGWEIKELFFNMSALDNRHTLHISGGIWSNKENIIHTIERVKDDDGNYSYNPTQIPWEQRNDEDVINRVAPFKHYVFDSGSPTERRELETLAQSYKDGSPDEALAEKYKVVTAEEATALHERSLKKRKVFISQFDFVEFVQKAINDENCKKIKFKVTGDIEYYYSANKDTYYENLNVTRIQRVDNDKEEKSDGNFLVYYDKNAIDKGSVKEEGCYYINAYVFTYDNQYENNRLPAPIMLKLPDEKLITKIMLKNFKVEGRGWKELGVTVSLINGAQLEELTPDVLTENEKEMLEAGLATMEEIVRDRGGKVFGEYKKEYVIESFARGWMSGAKDTEYVNEDFSPQPKEGKAEKEVDIFEDDDLDLELD